jgi:predicted patatin/cPLA2 family phospholipase
MVVRTRAFDFVKRRGMGTLMTAAMERKRPGVAQAHIAMAEAYARAAAFIRNPPSDCSIVHVAPLSGLRTSRTTKDLSTLHADYAFGRHWGTLAMRQWERQPASLAA